MKIGIVAEKVTGERRVALVPGSLAALNKAGLEVLVEQGAGRDAGFPDAAYTEKGAQVIASRADVFAAADIILQVRLTDPSPFRAGQVVIGMADPLGAPQGVRDLASKGVTAFALELIPRITRAIISRCR